MFCRWLLKNFCWFVLPAAFIALSLSSIVQKSPTYDESVHLFAGYAYLKWGDFRINPEHPPLAKMLAAAPLMALDLDTSGITPLERYKVQRDKNYGWVLAHRLVFRDNDAESVFFYARLVMGGLATLLALWVGHWARELYGVQAAVIALTLFCLDPNLIAHSSVVQTDFPFALFFFGATYFFWRSLQRLSWVNLVMTAGLCALAALTKFSAVIILPIWIALGLIRIRQAMPLQAPLLDPPEVDGRARKASLVAVVLIVSATSAYLAVWGIYQLRFDAVLFQHGNLANGSADYGRSLSQVLLGFAHDHMLLPEALLFGAGDAYARMARTAYLLGEISANGFWLYFPIVFVVKTPVPTLLAILLSIPYMILRRPKLPGAVYLLVPVALFAGFAVWSRLNVGWRHLIPIYPFLLVWLAGALASLWQSGLQGIRITLVLLGFWLGATTLFAYPDYLAYFNEAVGGSRNGSAILVDSNLDWGQDLKALKKWMADRRIDKLQLAYFGTADPAYYKIDSVPLPGSAFSAAEAGLVTAEKPQYLAVSETLLAGLYLDERDRYAYLRNRTPVAIIGHSIRVYKLDN
jgi:hypothetical protein